MVCVLHTRNLEMIEFLIDKAGANPTLLCMEQSHRMGMPLLTLAEETEGCEHIVVFLKQRVGDSAGVGNQGYTAFHLRPKVSALMDKARRLSSDVRELTDMLHVDEEHPTIAAYRRNAFVWLFGCFLF